MLNWKRSKLQSNGRMSMTNVRAQIYTTIDLTLQIEVWTIMKNFHLPEKLTAICIIAVIAA
jgi:hypothetical protein